MKFAIDFRAATRLAAVVSFVFHHTGAARLSSFGNRKAVTRMVSPILPPDRSVVHNRRLQDGGRIVNGTLAPANTYKSFASSRFGNPYTSRYYALCGGTLIWPDIVLTAAHCIEPTNLANGAFFPKSYILIGGIKQDGSDAEQVTVANVYRHPQYDSSQIVNDIAIVKLTTASSSPIQTLNTDSTNPSLNDPVTVIGFGRTDTTVSYYGNLRQATISAVSNGLCGIYNGFNPSTMICTSGGTSWKGECRGDSGGPLYDSSLNQIGIVSYSGSVCVDPTLPGVYTRVSYYQGWIYGMICTYSSYPPSDCPPPTPAPTTSPSCFSGINRLEVKDIGSIPMEQLKIGDYVRGGNGDYTQVYGFSHRNKHATTEFLQLILEYGPNKYFDRNSSTSLEITQNHLLFVERNERLIVVPAKDVVINDVLVNNNKDSRKKVKGIRKVIRNGIYAPLTFTGYIEVSGVVASSHVDILNHPVLVWNQHMLGQAMWIPRRLYCHFFMNTCKKESYDENGYSIWASWLIRFASVINMCGWMGALIVNMIGIPCMIMLHMLEPYPGTALLLVMALPFIDCFPKLKNGTDSTK